MRQLPRMLPDTSQRARPDSPGEGRHRALQAVLLAGLLGILPSCGPPKPAPAHDADAEDAALVESIERRVAESIAGVRESALALEYAAADAPTGARRVATGVMVNDRGDVLSIRIDPPSATSPIVARNASGVRLPAQWVAADPETGLTLLRIDPSAARPVRPAARGPRLGSQVLVIGNPFGLGHSVIRGQVAGLDRRVDVGPRPLGGLIQVDAALHPGDSGALVANLRGEWLGLIRSGLAAPGAGRTLDHDLGFAIPARDALWIADQLRTRRRVDRAYLGVRLNLNHPPDPPGAVLTAVLAESPAAKAGLQVGDRVVALDNHPIGSPGDLTDRLDRTPANAEVAFDYQRGPRRIHLTLRTASRPPLEPPPSPPLPKDKEQVQDDVPPAGRLPRALAERLDQLERRVQELEESRQTRAARRP